jgi:hypothetical protein
MQNVLIGAAGGAAALADGAASGPREIHVVSRCGVLCPARLAGFDRVWAWIAQVATGLTVTVLGRRKELRATGAPYVAVADRMDGGHADARACCSLSGSAGVPSSPRVNPPPMFKTITPLWNLGLAGSRSRTISAPITLCRHLVRAVLW